MSKQTINTLPAADASFMADLQEFLTSEIADRMQLMCNAGDFIYSGGTASTSGSLTHTISACIGMPDWYYVSQPEVSHTYTNGKTTYVYIMDDDERVLTIPSATVTYDGNLAFATKDTASIPTLPTGCLPLMTVTTSGGSITAVTDTRTTDYGCMDEVAGGGGGFTSIDLGIVYSDDYGRNVLTLPGTDDYLINVLESDVDELEEIRTGTGGQRLILTVDHTDGVPFTITRPNFSEGVALSEDVNLEIPNSSSSISLIYSVDLGMWIVTSTYIWEAGGA